MIANVNPETGIRYGVVALNSLEDWVWDEFFYYGENLTAESALEEWRAENPDLDEQDFWDGYEGHEEEYELETDGMQLGLSYLGGAPLVWVYQSPHLTRVRECSPCVPNAGDLDATSEDGVECYTLPEEWFLGEDDG